MSDPIKQQTDAPPFERGLWCRAWFMVLLCLVFAALDWELVPLLVFPFVFVFPVMLVAWNRGIWFSMICAALLSLTRVAHEFVFEPKPVSATDLADALIQFFVLLLVTALTTLLGRQTRQLRQRVRALEGMLPICSFCKCIRDDRGDWVQLERYIAGHSEAQFTHSLCPTCAKVHYGDYLPPRQQG